ncbi:hypothetical protein EJD97_018290 [Solanum chilense]|uniref:NTF2 domain-containing protein n=1 Tax=Solanum chilense TaxID=4083 RepID=A0A6N2AFZ9_SOLCI|nr:hypothetical protein EJD97_018290 [Solanum chilense]
MAMQTVAQPSAQVVGNTFVEQYYQIQHHSPESVYRFYQDSSVLSRPDANGVMTTMKVLGKRNYHLSLTIYLSLTPKPSQKL